MLNKHYPHEIIQPTKNLDVYFQSFIDDGSFTPSHWHNSIEIIYILSGSLQVAMDNSTYNLKENDCILINSSVVHSTRCIGGNTSVLLQIPSSLLKKYMPDYKTYYFDFKLNSHSINNELNLQEVKEILKSMKILDESEAEASHIYFTSLVFKLLFILYNNFRVTLGSNQKQQSSRSLSTLEPILEYTKANYNRPISIDEISKVAHLQPEYFCRKFKTYMGQTYLEYLNEIRLGHIYEDLLNTNKALYNILETHGFTNTKLFYRIFREKFNCTPAELRKKDSR